MSGGSKASERARELRRRRHRKVKVQKLAAKLTDGKPADAEALKMKIRRLTPGAEVIFANLGI